MIREGSDLSWLANVERDARNIEEDYRIDIAISVSEQMNRLGISQGDLAKAMGIGQAQVSRIVTAKQNLTIRTLARLEKALGLSLGSGFNCHQDRAEMAWDVAAAPDGRRTGGWESHAGHGGASHRLSTIASPWGGSERIDGARRHGSLKLVRGAAA